MPQGLETAVAQRLNSSAHPMVWSRALVTGLGAVILGLVTPGAMIMDRRPDLELDLLSILMIPVLWTSLRVAQAVTRRTTALASGVFWIFSYVFVSLAPLVQYMAATYPQGGSYAGSTVATSALVVIVGLAGFELGYRACRNSREADTRSVSPRRVLWVSLVGMGASLVALDRLGPAPFFSSRDGASAAFSTSLTEQSANLDQSTAIELLRSLIRFPSLIALVAVLWLMRAGARHAHLRIAAIALLTLNIVVNNPISNPRYWAGTVLFSVAAVYIPWGKAHVRRLVLLSVLAAATLSLDYLDAFRREAGVDLSSSPLTQRLTEHPDYGPSQQMLDATVYSREEGHQVGRQTLGAALVFVPRSMWSSKPISSQALVKQSHVRYAGAVPLWGELYLDFGFWGTALGFAAFGFGLRRMDTSFHRLTRNIADSSLNSRALPSSIFVPTVAAFQLFFIRGSLQPAAGAAIPLLLAIAITSPPTKHKRLSVRTV